MHSVAELLKRGLQAHDQGDLDAAAEAYRAALELDPDSASAHNNLGFLLSQQQQWQPALLHLRSAIALDPHSSMAHCNLGQVLIALQQ